MRLQTILLHGTSGKECWGTYSSTANIGHGPGYQYSCIHSGTIATSGDLPTTWYNYALATAGTIIDENTSFDDPAKNVTKATESVCPKGWTLPDNIQINSNRDVINFSPVLGGYYNNGAIYNKDTRGYWWGSTAYNGARRYYLYYDNSSLDTNNSYRPLGFYIRCVQAP